MARFFVLTFAITWCAQLGIVAHTALVSVWVSWVYERAGIFGAIAAHAGVNLGLFGGRSEAVSLAVWAVIAAAVIWRGGDRRR